ncbi:Hypothetical protein EPM1_4343 [Stenotrophomonas maltophilia EPM1]|nr:Hypothetical protein EPM1_4343 [Stenotrophomonas maltophilia EPM1]
MEAATDSTKNVRAHDSGFTGFHCPPGGALCSAAQGRRRTDGAKRLSFVHAC